MRLKFGLNGDPVDKDINPSLTLLELLRSDLGAVGTKGGCMTGDCGACTVLLDGSPILSCLQIVAQLEGRQVTTIEGVAHQGELTCLQQSFVELGAVQCGFCTPGIIMTAIAYVESDVDVDEESVREHISGNLCRCTGYSKIVEAILAAARRDRQEQ